MAYNLLNDIMRGYEFGSQLSKDMEAAQIKRAENEYWKSISSTQPTTNVPLMAKPTVPGDYVPGKTISGQDTMLPRGAISLTGQSSDVTTAPLTELAMVKDPYAEPPKDLIGGMITDASAGKEPMATPVETAQPIMTQHMKASTESKTLNDSIEQQKGLIRYLREKGYSAQAAAKEKDLYDLQNKASVADFNRLKYQSAVLDEVGGVLNGYIKMAEKDPANEARYRAIGIRQLQSLGYDGNIIASNDPNENIAAAKQIYASTTTAKENTKFELQARDIENKENATRIRAKHNDAMETIANQKIALGRDKFDSKRATEILKSYDNEVNKLRSQYELADTRDDKAMFKALLESAQREQANARRDFKAQATREKVPFTDVPSEETPSPEKAPSAKPKQGVKFTDKATKDVQAKYADAMKRATTEEQRKAITDRMIQMGYIGQ